MSYKIISSYNSLGAALQFSTPLSHTATPSEHCTFLFQDQWQKVEEMHAVMKKLEADLGKRYEALDKKVDSTEKNRLLSELEDSLYTAVRHTIFFCIMILSYRLQHDGF